MVAYYSVFGRHIGSHHLAMVTLAGYVGIPYLFMKTRPSKPANAAPPINASSSDEESFIKQFMEQAEKEEKH
ncbi:hypothetical protein MKZ38_003166 [Zalerion maritima]|uniref:Uncharacterized protein n=1 Tax=Zalerion maritima TaxID=339359 RepID=A0AAD5RYU0_9PEZI|nr:hypothetical protein MKZ38_003166 [Zalerion maritima]